MRRAVRRWLLTGLFPSKRYSFGPVTGGEGLVAMCLWNRPTRVADVLAMMDAQDFPGGVRLFLWNNNRANHGIYEKAIESYRANGGLREVNLVKSPYNLGSIARFYWVRKLARTLDAPPVIVLDDDQDVRNDFVSVAIASCKRRTLTAWWAWRMTDVYWERTEAQVGDSIGHIGPGGMVADSALFLDSDFFTQIPDRFGLLDDIWLSHFAVQKGYTLAKLPVDIDFVMHETNQFFYQHDTKSEFYAYLKGF